MLPLLEARLLACPDLPTLPAVALQVLELCRREDKDIDELARVVESDPAIAAKLLRLANSASLATRSRISTLSRAITIVGTHATVSTALSFSLVRSRRGEDTGGFDHAQFWRRAVFCAVAARALGEIHGIDREESFLSGLLQDIGMLAMVRVLPSEYGRVWAPAKGDHARVADREREAFGFDHVDAGLVLARQWSLPPALIEAIAGSHVPVADAHGHRLAEIAFLSGPLADVWAGPASGDGLVRAVSLAEACFGSTADEVASALARMALAVPEAASDFDIDLGGRALADAIEGQARALLSSRGLPRAPRGGVVRLPSLEPALEEAFHHARTNGCALATVLVAPEAPGTADDLSAMVAACLRGTDAVAVRGATVCVLLFDPAPGGCDAVVARIRTRTAAAGARVAIGWAELRPGDQCPAPPALLRAAEHVLEDARAASEAPGPAGDPRGGEGPRRSSTC